MPLPCSSRGVHIPVKEASLCIGPYTGEALACKSISKRKLATPDDVEDVRREVQILLHLSGHKNVVQLKVCAVYAGRLACTDNRGLVTATQTRGLGVQAQHGGTSSQSVQLEAHEGGRRGALQKCEGTEVTH
jgi:hypothetical protein